MLFPNQIRLSTHGAPLGLIDSGFSHGFTLPLGLNLAAPALGGLLPVSDQASLPGSSSCSSPLDHEDGLPCFAPVHDMQGFDDTVTPHWQMVPLGEFRDVALRLPVGAETLIVTSTAPEVATVNYDEGGLPAGVVRIHGLAGRSCRIEVHDTRGRLRTSLEVTVKASMRRKLAFFSLSDKKGPHAPAPFDAGAPVAGLVTGVNGIFLPQANIAVEATAPAIRELKIDRRLGRRITQRELDRHIYPALLKAADGALPVLFVGDYEDKSVSDTSTKGVFRRLAGTGGAIVLDARSEHIASSLAHEFGHALVSHSQYHYVGRAGDHSPRREDLMYAKSPHGNRLRKDDVTVMNIRGLA